MRDSREQGAGMRDQDPPSRPCIKIVNYITRINKFFEVDFAIKVNASKERRFDRSTVIFKFGVRIKLHV